MVCLLSTKHCTIPFLPSKGAFFYFPLSGLEQYMSGSELKMAKYCPFIIVLLRALANYCPSVIAPVKKITELYTDITSLLRALANHCPGTIAPPGAITDHCSSTTSLLRALAEHCPGATISSQMIIDHYPGRTVGRQIVTNHCPSVIPRSKKIAEARLFVWVGYYTISTTASLLYLFRYSMGGNPVIFLKVVRKAL